MEAKAILQPVFVLGLLTVVMTCWMFLTRVPAMKRLKIHPQKGQDTAKLKALLPEEVNRVSNNYNHLFEQPTLFYAVAISIAALGHVDSFYVGCAWSYTVLRIGHSLVQATIDRVMVRFGLFILSWLVLIVMVVREAIAVFS
ncbi:MAPEG family protein [Thalassomonas haliotis]|uniref:MAPEG family protein n=1 Tax=Thalassomonas haliotis TaxID=485448 RepID=A0ABY7V932_9GAMM|nr:MAPEG family protein [Thalassomonas haliotis]WDE09417.1 MAPEG family protein [Thalassomonas haliotis]